MMKSSKNSLKQNFKNVNSLLFLIIMSSVKEKYSLNEFKFDETIKQDHFKRFDALL